MIFEYCSQFKGLPFKVLLVESKAASTEVCVKTPPSHVHTFSQSTIFTAKKQSLGQGNVFTPVCQSFCSWGGALCIMPLPVLLPGPMFLPRCLCLAGLCPAGFWSSESLCKVSVRGISVQGWGFVGRPLPAIRKAGDTHSTGMLSCIDFQIEKLSYPLVKTTLTSELSRNISPFSNKLVYLLCNALLLTITLL